MSVVLCLPAHLRVSTAASRGQAPHGNASGVAPVVVEGANAVGGWRCCCDADAGGAGDGDGEGAAGRALGIGAAGDANVEGVVGDALGDGAAGDALTVRWGWALATPGGGSCGCCWPVHRSWQHWPTLVSGQLLATPGDVDAHGVAGVVRGDD